MASATTTKPLILLVAGSFALPCFYKPIFEFLPSDIDLQIPHLPSVGLGKDAGRPGPATSMYVDAHFILHHIRRLVIEERRNVIVSAHSYGGVSSTEALGLAQREGFFRKDRQARGEQGGVVRVGYFTALIPKVGANTTSLLHGVKEEDQMDFQVDEQGWMSDTRLEQTARVCASSMTPEARRPWFDQFPRHSSVSLANELAQAGYRNLPFSYLVAEDDLCIPVAVQRHEIAKIENETGNKVDVTSEKIDHVPNISAPHVLSDWLVSMVEMH